VQSFPPHAIGARHGEVRVKIGTRGSPLALAQAHEVRARLCAAHGWREVEIGIEVIRTTGDAILDRPLAEAGGKGLFTKEIEQALAGGVVDLAVHSGKDVPTWRPDELVIAAWLPREDVRDVFISPKAASLKALAAGAVVGTASLRRQALVRRLRPDLNVISFRGNVQTRLRKLNEGEADATLLALAGLNRLDLAGHATQILSSDEFLPAVAQGAIAVEARRDDADMRAALAVLNDPPTAIAVTCERAFLARLDGSCRTPIAGHCVVDGDRIAFRGLVVAPDGQLAHEARREGGAGEAVVLGVDAAEELLARGGEAFFAALRAH